MGAGVGLGDGDDQCECDEQGDQREAGVEQHLGGKALPSPRACHRHPQRQHDDPRQGRRERIHQDREHHQHAQRRCGDGGNGDPVGDNGDVAHATRERRDEIPAQLWPHRCSRGVVPPPAYPSRRSARARAGIMPRVATMRAVVWAGPRAVDVVERELTDPPPGWVRLRVAGAGICGSDLHNYRRGGLPASTPGHEVGGVVEAVGDGVELELGAKVAVEPVAVCFRCYECLTGQTWHCQNRVFLGGDGAGGMAEVMLAPETSAYPLPERVPAEAGSLAEPVAVAVHAVNESGIRLGSRAVVLGAGTVGLVNLLVARRAGATEVYITARHPFQAEMARALGATAVFPDGTTARRELKGLPVDAVIETVGGSAPTIAEGISLVRNRGTVVMLGAFGSDVALPATPLLLKEVRLVGAVCYGRPGPRTEFGLATDLLDELLEPLAPLVTHTFPLDRAVEAFATADDKSSGSIKVRLTP